ncbi:hypothetical protein EVAR_22925_1 [Eumeta japonica]|uniref:Uncharacterized protein n=1 Tax=Eumeta variegata TaxID=151549 RepID=A0A4C1UU51_EUMVA|nr:hypothetical protein EVAR_22925_1 [Eumeta japonica]
MGTGYEKLTPTLSRESKHCRKRVTASHVQWRLFASAHEYFFHCNVNSRVCTRQRAGRARRRAPMPRRQRSSGQSYRGLRVLCKLTNANLIIVTNSRPLPVVSRRCCDVVMYCTVKVYRELQGFKADRS